MFPRHLSSYIILLLNDWKITIVTICCFIWYNYNKIFRMTHYCSNDPIPRIKSITIVNACDFSHFVAWENFPSIWKQIYYFPDGGSFSNDVLVEGLFWCLLWLNSIWVCSVVVFVSLNSVALWLFFLGVEKYCESSLMSTSVSTLFVVVMFYKDVGQMREII